MWFLKKAPLGERNWVGGKEDTNPSFWGLRNTARVKWAVETLEEGEAGKKIVTMDEHLVKSEAPFKDVCPFFPMRLKL